MISLRAPVGTTNFADQDYSIGRGLSAITAKPGLADSVFLLHAMQQNLGFLHRRSQGSTFLAIGSKELSALQYRRTPPHPHRSAAALQRISSRLDPKEWEVGGLRQWLSYLSYGFTNPMPEADEGPYMVTAADIYAGRISVLQLPKNHAQKRLKNCLRRSVVQDLAMSF